MFICVEGPDGSGKTSLAKEICSQMDSHYMHLTYRWYKRKHQQVYYYVAARNWLLKHTDKKYPAVLDRWWLSETVYADVFRDGSIALGAWELLDNKSICDKIINVMCLPKSIVTCISRHAARPQEEMYHSVSDVYYRYMDWWEDRLSYRPNWILYQSDVMTIKQGASLVLNAYFQQLEYGVNNGQ